MHTTKNTHSPPPVEEGLGVEEFLYTPLMISSLRGVIHKGPIGEVTVDISGVGYRVKVPLDTWEMLQEGDQRLLWISTYVREDRLDLYGFPEAAGRLFFEELINMQGIGPRLGLELCAVPKDLLTQAIREEDASILQSIKGIGRKTAEKLLLELKSLAEKQSDLFRPAMKGGDMGGQYDQDAVEALKSLGYDTSTVLDTLKKLPKDLKTTEERVTAALRAL
ncbi:MAG: Holliday junction DNA helicase subunit RuvA [Candidatus Peregrinibacteria bacterium Greene0416_62]|nr:MAG: Holliday junction DNA helicase subunit RuvA [Candidatus Peregrinibacteria bacterium Greene0416_62]TSD00684.1 MAG: Holliday junction DNA helicase subunit RuvA [Candidatus Peregrinibacteria bacterium Greene1014_49]